MIQNVRAYIMDRQEQMQRIVSYISFQTVSYTHLTLPTKLEV